MIKLGYAETDITPKIPMQLVGFNRTDNMSRGVLKPLLAQVSIWESGDRYCLITIDNIGFKKELADILRIKVSNSLKVSYDKVMLCFSHCHSAPNVADSEEYFEMVCRNILMAVYSAKIDMHPVLVGWDNVEVDIGVNRRQDNINLDKRAGILKVCGLDKEETKLLLIRVTAHCNVLKRDNYLISPDYFGSIRELLQENYGCPIMVIQGSAGNIAPKYFDSTETPIDARGAQYIRSSTALEDMAAIVWEELSQRIALIEVADMSAIDMYSREMSLYADIPSLIMAEKIAEEAMNYCGIDGRAWLEEIKGLHNTGVYRQEETIEVQYFAIGKWCICGVPYELMVEFALESMEKLNNPFFYVNGYTNACLSYFPTEEEYDKGGYEVYWSILLDYKYFNRVFPFERDSASKLIEFILENVPITE